LAVFKRSRSIFLMTFLSVILLYQNGQKVYMQLYYAGIKPGTDGIRHTCKSAEESWPALGPGWSGQWSRLCGTKTFGIAAHFFLLMMRLLLFFFPFLRLNAPSVFR
jgi:hypothetical protein